MSTLVERERELTALESAIDEAASGRGGMVVVTGEAGAGKTALLHAFCERSAGSARVLRGMCDGLRTPQPLGPLHDIAATTGDALIELLRGDPVPYAVATALIDELRGGPAIVVVEDIHWADEATLDVLRLVARRIETVRAVLAVSYREEELDPRHPVRLMVGELASAVSLRRVPLSPLSPDAVARLAEPYGIDPLELHRTTAGNAFFVTEVLAAGGSGDPGHGPRRRPRPHRAALAGRAGRARRCRGRAAARGDLALETLSGADSTHGSTSASPRACSSRWARASRSGTSWPASPSRSRSHRPARAALHRAALDALLARGRGDRDLARLAHHAEAAGDRDAVLELAPLAAALCLVRRRTSGGGRRSMRARSASPRACPPTRSRRLLDAARARVLPHRSGRRRDRCASRRVRPLSRAGTTSGDRARRLRPSRTSSGAPAAVRRPGRSRTRRSTCSSRSPPARSSCMPTRRCRSSAIPRRSGAAAQEWATRAHELAARTDDPAAVAHALFALGRLRVRRRPRAAGPETVLRARALAEQSGLEAIAAESFLTLGEIDAGLEYCRGPRRRADRAVPRRRALPRRAERGPLDGRDERPPRVVLGRPRRLDLPDHAVAHGAGPGARAPRRPRRRAPHRRRAEARGSHR